MNPNKVIATVTDKYYIVVAFVAKLDRDTNEKFTPRPNDEARSNNANLDFLMSI